MTTRAAPNVRPFADRMKRMAGARIELTYDSPEVQVWCVQAKGGEPHNIDVVWSANEWCICECDCDAAKFLKDPEGCIHREALRLRLLENDKMTNTTELTTSEYVGDIVPQAPLGLGSALMMRDVLTPRNVNEALELAKLFHQSGMFGVSNPGQAFVILSLGMELGLSVSQAFRSIHVIKNKPTLSADILVALCKQSPACIYFKLVESDDQHATYQTQRHGEDPTPMTFTFKEAQRAGLVAGGGNWDKYPAAMCRARASAALARAVYPDVCAGLYTPEEARAIDVTPVRSETPAQRPVNQVQEAVSVSSDETKAIVKGLNDYINAAIKAMSPDVKAMWEAWMAQEFNGTAYKKLSIEQLATVKQAIADAVEVAGGDYAPLPPNDPEDDGVAQDANEEDDKSDPFA